MLPQRLRVFGTVGLVAALAVWAWPSAPGDAAQRASGPALAQLFPPPADAPDASPALQPRTSTAAAEHVRALVPPPARAGFVPISVVAPRRLRVGEMNELVIGLGANEAVGEISFTVQVDPNVLQLRAGTEGDWAAGASLPARFTADISSVEDRVRVHGAAPGRRAAAGTVALVQFQAMAPGSTSVTISDVVLTDVAGRPMAAALSATNLQLTVE